MALPARWSQIAQGKHPHGWVAIWPFAQQFGLSIAPHVISCTTDIIQCIQTQLTYIATPTQRHAVWQANPPGQSGSQRLPVQHAGWCSSGTKNTCYLVPGSWRPKYWQVFRLAAAVVAECQHCAVGTAAASRCVSVDSNQRSLSVSRHHRHNGF
jgi:hypothetical protein